MEDTNLLLTEAILQEIKNLNDKLELHNLKVLDVDKLSAYTGLSKDTIYKYTRNSQIPHSKRGKKLFFDREAIDSWLLRQRYGEHTI
tara:strand:+ start:13954 stop:14214 length:261 start_codon:yes stop_codon:yes gene_type:complete